MTGTLLKVFLFALIPAFTVLLGGVAATFRAPGAAMRSAVQHFAAGLLFAAIASELLPDVLHRPIPVAATIGFAAGVALMLGVKQWTEKAGPKGVSPESTGLASARAEAQGETKGKGAATSLVITVAIDIAIDGLLVGLSFHAGQKQGLLLTGALSLEALFLGLSVAVALAGAGAARSRIVSTSAMLGAILITGAVAGAALVSVLSGAAMEAVLSFGVAALLYLVTGELLVEAHEEKETPLLTAAFFGGFLALMLVEMVA